MAQVNVSVFVFPCMHNEFNYFLGRSFSWFLFQWSSVFGNSLKYSTKVLKSGEKAATKQDKTAKAE